MEEELEKKEIRTEQGEINRDGVNSNESQEDYREPIRPQRPRIHSQRAYGSSEDGAFRPEGFGAGLQNPNTQQRGGYRQQRNNYGGGYQQPRQGYQQPRQPQGYRQRYGDDGGYQQPRQGGYQQMRQGYQQPRQPQGYRQRYGDDGGYQQPRQGGYQQMRQGYQQPRQPQGYQQRYNGNNRQGYNNYPSYQNRYNPRQGYQQSNNRLQHAPGYDSNAKYSLKKRIEYKEENIDPNEPIRLNKYLANAGVCSRREADEFIQAGGITVNGEVVTELGTKILRSDEVKFRDKIVSLEKKVYVLLNKPKDYVTTSDDPQQRKTVMDLVKGACPERIYPVGRLDRNTTGVLLLTNDGNLASKLTHPKFLKKKVYHVFLDKPVTAQHLQQISEGIILEDGEVKADAVEYASDKDQKQVGIEIHSGKNRIVRRIFESLGYRVTKLDRVQFAGLTKKNVRRGDWRFLTEQEVDMLRMGAFE